MCPLLPHRDVSSILSLQEIALKKLPDTNTDRIESVVKMIEGTARSIGLKVVG